MANLGLSTTTTFITYQLISAVYGSRILGWNKHTPLLRLCTLKTKGNSSSRASRVLSKKSISFLKKESPLGSSWRIWWWLSEMKSCIICAQLWHSSRDPKSRGSNSSRSTWDQGVTFYVFLIYVNTFFLVGSIVMVNLHVCLGHPLFVYFTHHCASY